MKRINVLLLSMATILLLSCGNDEEDIVPADEPAAENPAQRGLTDTDTETTGLFKMTAAQRAAVTPLNDFSLNLFREYSQKKGADNSAVVSPLSVAMLMGMLNEGASGNTCGEIQKALGLSDKTKDDINLLMSKLINGLGVIDPSVTVALANNITINNRYTLLPNYEKALKDYYQASAYALDFTDPSSAETINNWCSKHTNGLIKDMIEQTKADAVAYLLNAIYFKGAWTNPFNKEETEFRYFSGLTDLIRMTCRRGMDSYYENTLFSALRLPMGNGSYAMTILLPREEKGLEKMIKALNAEMISQMTFQEYDVLTHLPIFRTENEIDLISILENMGVHEAFGVNAQFPDMIQDINESLYVSMMKQKSSLGIDEDGCEGAAVTLAEMMCTSDGDEDPQQDTDKPQRYFNADHPFAYIISEKETGAILFIGQFCGK